MATAQVSMVPYPNYGQCASVFLGIWIIVGTPQHLLAAAFDVGMSPYRPSPLKYLYAWKHTDAAPCIYSGGWMCFGVTVL